MKNIHVNGLERLSNNGILRQNITGNMEKMGKTKSFYSWCISAISIKGYIW